MCYDICIVATTRLVVRIPGDAKPAGKIAVAHPAGETHNPSGEPRVYLVEAGLVDNTVPYHVDIFLFFRGKVDVAVPIKIYHTIHGSHVPVSTRVH